MLLEQAVEICRLDPLTLLGRQPTQGLFPRLKRWHFQAYPTRPGLSDNYPVEAYWPRFGDNCKCYVSSFLITCLSPSESARILATVRLT